MAKTKQVKSPAEEKKDDIIPKPEYSDKEVEYIKFLRQRMESARNARELGHDEFDGMSYSTWYETNERLANTFIQPKRNKEDSNFQSGIIRQKLFALLAPLVNLDLRGDISAFSQEGFEVQSLGDAMEDIHLKTNEYDTDDEKKLLRQYELLKQGSVFVEELWDEKNKVVKKPSKKFDGAIKGFDFTSELKKAFARPTRNIISGLNVYLGDITKYDSSEQPYIFTAIHIPYTEAEATFKNWERWENVPKTLQKFEQRDKTSPFNKDWTLLQVEQGYVEILRYQDKWANEYALMLNGVLMTPVGMPLPWGYEDYNIAQQNLEPIHAKFAYGKSLVARTKNKVALLDEMMKLAILKTQKSFMPPYLNLSGRVLSNRVFMPGKINHGIPPNTLIPVNDKESQGVTVSELNMIKELQESINNETTSPTFSGQQASGDPTATEIIELQRQAKQMLGLTIFSVSMLEWKLEWLRLQNLLANWFQPEDQVVDKAREVLKNKYRKTTTDYSVQGEGSGKRMVIPMEGELPSPKAVMQTEDQLSQEQGMPIRIIFLNPEEVCSAKLVWQIVVAPKERKTSEVQKLLFRGFLQDILPLGPNMEYIRERAASVWGENPKKLFAQDPEQMKQQALAAQQGQNPQAGGGTGTVSPRVNLPNAAQAAGDQLSQALKTGQ